MIRTYKNGMLAIAASLGLAMAQSAGAASVSYDLWNTNDPPPPDGWTYATVTIDDGGTADNLFTFTVQLTSNPYFQCCGPNYSAKLAVFGFNTLDDRAVTFSAFNPASATGGASGPGPIDGFGVFDWEVNLSE